MPNLWGGLQAKMVELNDGRIIVTSVTPGGRAAGAGFAFGTQILSVGGVPVDQILDQPLRTLEFPGTPETNRMLKVNHLLSHAPGTEVEVGYQQPGATGVMTAVLTAVPDAPKKTEKLLMPMEYKLVDGVGYVTWRGFERTGIATHIFADFVKVMNEQQIPGIIIDLRGNSGGSDLMQYAVMSYLFGEDKPLTFDAADNYRYSQQAGKFTRSPQNFKLSSPPNEHPYLGDVVILVDDQCASSCEFMSYWLQANKRATIVGQHATEGAGGNTHAVYLPGLMQFNYTSSTIVDNKTNMPAFQGVGVQPDVRVPVTEETERRKLEGGDPVLDAGIQHLRRLALARLDLQPAPFASGTITTVVPTNWRPRAAGDGYSSPDLPLSLTIQPWTATADTDPDAIDPAKRIGSLVFNPGGPGSAGSGVLGIQAEYGAPFTARLREYFDLVALDPRGVGLSTPIKCDPEIWNEGGSLFPQDQAAYDAMVAHNKAFGESCLENTGPALAYMDTVSVARDLDAIRAALGEEKLNYFGLSYGTMVGAQYAELFPDKIRVMALDGALDHSQSENAWHFVEVKAYEQVFGRFAGWCGQSTDCALNGKDVLKEFDALIAQANETPIPAPDCVASGACRTTVTGDDIRSSIQEVVLNVSKWPELGESLAKSMAGDASAFAFELRTGPTSTDFAETAIQCLDWPAATNDTFEGLQARHIFDVAAAPHTQGASQSWRAQTRCVGWPVPMTNPPRPLVVEGAPPLLIVNATFDPSTSMQWALEMSSQLPSAALLIRQGYGHTTYANPGESQVRDAIDKYLITGKTPPPNTVMPN